MSGRNNFDFLDALSAVSFLIAVANYRESRGQTDLQEIAQGIIKNINNHLQEQDRKIDEIYNILKEKESEKDAPKQYG